MVNVLPFPVRNPVVSCPHNFDVVLFTVPPHLLYAFPLVYHFIPFPLRPHFSVPQLLTWDALVDVISFCPDIRPYRAVIHDPLLQSPDFPCENEKCRAFKAKFKATKSQKQDAKVLAKLRDTDYKVRVEGYSFTDVKERLKHEGIKMVNIWKLPGAELQKWNLYTEDKLKEMSAKGDSYDDIKIVRSWCLPSIHEEI